MKTIKKLWILSLVALPGITYCMDKPGSEQNQEQTICCNAETMYYGTGQIIACSFVNDIFRRYPDAYAKQHFTAVCASWGMHPYYDYRNDQVDYFIKHYEKSKNKIYFAYYKSLYKGLLNNLLDREHFDSRIQSSHLHSTSAKIIAFWEYDKALRYAQTMASDVVKSMDQVIELISRLTEVTKQQESYYQKGKNVGKLEVDYLDNYGLYVQNYEDWYKKCLLFSNALHAINNDFERVYKAGLTNNDQLFHCWMSFYQGYYDVISHCNMKLMFTQTLNLINLTTANKEELEKIKQLSIGMHQQQQHSLEYIEKALSCKNMQHVIAFIDSFKFTNS